MLDITKHKIILVNILKDIYGDIDLASCMGFKGGTAAFLFHELPRFSVDLDFNLLKDIDDKFVQKKMEKIAIKYGQIEESAIKHFTIFLLVAYEKGIRKMKIEISKRKTGDSYEIKQYFGMPVLVMSKADMAANKIVAMLERKSAANRDIFDVWYFLKNGWSINEDIVKTRTGIDLKDYLKKCVKMVETMNPKYILDGLGELLDNKQKIWAKENLKKEIIFWLKFYTENR